MHRKGPRRLGCGEGRQRPVALRAGRGEGFTAVHEVAPGTRVEVWYREAMWAWVSAPRSVPDDSGSEPTVHECRVFGWAASAAL